ncbi:UDP-N-acetylmuramoyl-L-alanyl-D-glutamate--2,6-diaminopimelate ligase [Conchiformibius steedae]|uniref:UDP-N-acetylmuramoyl-L-alanyl-D-glutamate--2,6-diaminopimelate ligase n=1 Tax=Conchiformibius steedae TaxID=153493 RepID=A0A3P2A8F3_9NEIS|nr:UDP-N-acetylmuramoyl-L-alanyl-D-glutamate--2,6-diaminopimelate ligase [Conchiformibius steedae]RRD91238.1 UDP-N-acetylmuramoyl-L-alanyl-D-glutamate--2,6-diaminopimelate ligase [Conchiformibius steedae]
MYSTRTPSLETEFPHLPDTVAESVTLHADSRKIRTGDVFVACQGEYVDGRDYIPAAIAQGASLVLWDDDGRFQWNSAWQVPNVGIADLRQRAGIAAAKLYGSVAEGLHIFGVTGTNGKTSITQWLAQAVDILEKQKSCAIMGTVGNGFWGALREATHTTPDPVSLQTLLRQFAREGANSVAMEVSSHGLDQCRVNGVPFTSAVFTNLTRDHLDYHGSMAAYGDTKARLFYWQGLKHAVINTDDDFGKELLQQLRQQRPELAVYGYGFAEHADIRISRFQASPDGMHTDLRTPWGECTVSSRLLGRFNVQNLAACIGVLCANGYPLADVAAALAQIRPATGRMDCIARSGKPLVVVDYAHTPDALEKALTTLREILPANGKLWCVFGCGGNRDRGKRPLMGAAAAAYSDYPVVTSDNPRMEEPQTIIDDILPAVSQPALVEADRRRAIEQAILQAAPDDVILIAGKGHETYQDIQGVKHHFSDFEEAEHALAKRLADSSGR